MRSLPLTTGDRRLPTGDVRLAAGSRPLTTGNARLTPGSRPAGSRNRLPDRLSFGGIVLSCIEL
ncbi:MAG: hypothetical protein J2P39_10725 [Candidatus Dormibacteraeota bacterium]|nr:hypothetical protein [Candidatus Dormibacteraeota bacterium]